MCGETMSLWNSDVGDPKRAPIQTYITGHKEVCVRGEYAGTSLNSSAESLRLTALPRTETSLNSDPKSCSTQATRKSTSIDGWISVEAETSLFWRYRSQTATKIQKTQCGSQLYEDGGGRLPALANV